MLNRTAVDRSSWFLRGCRRSRQAGAELIDQAAYELWIAPIREHPAPGFWPGRDVSRPMPEPYAAFDVRLPLLKIADFPDANGWKRAWRNRINETRQVSLSELATEKDAIEFPEKGKLADPIGWIVEVVSSNRTGSLTDTSDRLQAENNDAFESS